MEAEQLALVGLSWVLLAWAAGLHELGWALLLQVQLRI
jgi:hypothetical protein